MDWKEFIRLNKGGWPLSKKRLVARLPVTHDDILLRPWTINDTFRRALWPRYHYPYAEHTFSLRGAPKEKLRRHFKVRDEDPDVLHLAVDFRGRCATGYLMLRDIQWNQRIIGDIVIRIHPSWCGRGIGTSAIVSLLQWCREHAFRRIDLDVEAANNCAVRCFRKGGLRINSEFWEDDPRKSHIDITSPRYRPLRPHIRLKGGMPQVRYWVMRADLDHADSRVSPDQDLAA